ncbi:MAG: c-type cytochrome [Planctomycetota bacterium]|nr:c-type cytochrome [Planctomycetota bacterium]
MRIIKLGLRCFLAAALAGCSRLPDATYTLRVDAENIKLPAKHTQQIADYLDYLHGTPGNPRMSLPAEGDDESEAEADTSDEAAAAAGTPAISIARIDKPGYDRLTLKRGHEVYTAQCAGCHGTTGDGTGPAGQYLNPPPPRLSQWGLQVYVHAAGIEASP